MDSFQMENAHSMEKQNVMASDVIADSKCGLSLWIRTKTESDFHEKSQTILQTMLFLSASHHFNVTSSANVCAGTYIFSLVLHTCVSCAMKFL